MTLEHALLHEKELSELAAKELIKDKYKYYNTGYMALPQVEKDEWNQITFVSVSYCYGVKKLIGYLTANVDRTNDIISNIGMWSTACTFKEAKVFEKDLFSFILYLLKRFEVIEWSVVEDNPVRKKYRKFIEAVGGNIIGTMSKKYKIGKERMNAEYYELISSLDVINKVEKLRERIKL